jgi:hypothetical protein
MQGLIETVSIDRPHSHVRLVLESFDSGEECSLLHWLEVCKLVDEGEGVVELNDTEIIAELEPAAWN